MEVGPLNGHILRVLNSYYFNSPYSTALHCYVHAMHCYVYLCLRTSPASGSREKPPFSRLDSCLHMIFMILVRQIVLTLHIHVFGNFCLFGHENRHKTLYFFKEGPPSRVSSIMHFVQICINRTLATDQDSKIAQLWRPSL